MITVNAALALLVDLAHDTVRADPRVAGNARQTIEDISRAVGIASVGHERVESVEVCLGHAASCLDKGTDEYTAFAVGHVARAIGHLGRGFAWITVENAARTASAIAGGDEVDAG